MMQAYDVTALGEILIDFTPAGMNSQGSPVLEQNPGGAPANVLACISRLGRKTAFIGKVGVDHFGYFLKDVLENNKIDISGLCYSKEVHTTLAFVSLEANGERSFDFYRNPGADTTLNRHEVNYSIIEKSKIFHFGSLSLTDEPSRTATFSTLRFAKKHGCIVSYDPNLRPPLWKNLKAAKRQIRAGLGYADILKVSEEELEFIAGEKDLENATNSIYREYHIPLILVTRGAEGSFYRKGNITAAQEAFRIQAVDTTGAGDAFLGGFLYSLLQLGIKPPNELTQAELDASVRFSNATAALCCMKKGAIPAMPELNGVVELMKLPFIP